VTRAREEGVEDQCVSKELDTLLTALYVLVDDRVVPPRSGRGRRPLFTDSELLTVAVAQVLLRFDGERRWIRHVHSDPRWRSLFPHPPRQSGYNKRLRKAELLPRKTIITLAVCCPSWFDGLWITDATPCPVACPVK